MNPKLIKFIELCLVDGVISDKEREVVFRKSKEFGVPEDECEIILEGMIQKLGKKSSGNVIDEDELKDPETPIVSLKSKKKSKVKNEVKVIDNKQTPNNKNEIEKTNKIEVSVSEEKSNNDSKKKKVPKNKSKGSKSKGEGSNITPVYPSKIYDSIYSFGHDFSSNFVKNYYKKNRSNPLLLGKTEIIRLSNKVFGCGPFDHYSTKFSKIENSRIEFGIHRNGTGVVFYPDHISILRKESYDSHEHIVLYYDSLFKIGFPNKSNKSNVQLIDIWMRSQSHPTIFYQDIFTIKIKQFYDLDSLNKWENDGSPRSSGHFREIEKLNKGVFNLIVDFLKSYISQSHVYLKEKNRIEDINERERLRKERERLRKVKSNVNQIYKEFDKDGNGIIDVVEGRDDFMILFKKHQKKIIEVDKQYIQNFVKISNYFNTKRKNIQVVFSFIKKTNNQSELDENVGLLKNQIHTYEVLLFHSLNMITSIVEEDLIIFYEIYESFDKLNIFNSNWENEVSQQLENIGDGLSNLMYSIESMERNIVNGLEELSYVTQESFSKLNQSVSRELKSIDSSIKFNNLLTVVGTYQTYKINKNTK